MREWRSLSHGVCVEHWITGFLWAFEVWGSRIILDDRQIDGANLANAKRLVQIRAYNEDRK